MRIAFIRRHGRQGHCDIEQRRVYISLSLDGIPELWTGSIVHLRIFCGGTPCHRLSTGCTRCTSISVVCTHGKRDRCCAINGRPVADALDKYSRDRWGEEPALWEISHIAGHRFAPAFMTLPGNYMYGRLTPEEAIAVASAARQGYIDLTKLRGRTSLDAPAQAAELVVAQVLARESQLLTPGLLKATTLVRGHCHVGETRQRYASSIPRDGCGMWCCGLSSYHPVRKVVGQPQAVLELAAVLAARSVRVAR
ncbi:MAG: sucrase ferredoxin [Lawsonella clevelandensis]